MNTKERIIETAIRLFNEQGTRAVSTNHIAEALTMSPSNLYYYFRNKEEIIRAILERMFARWAALYTLPEEYIPQLTDVQQIVTENFVLVWDYRFFYRELSALVQRDPVLKDRYQQIRRRQSGQAQPLAICGWGIHVWDVRDCTTHPCAKSAVCSSWSPGSYARISATVWSLDDLSLSPRDLLRAVAEDVREESQSTGPWLPKALKCCGARAEKGHPSLS